MSSKIGVVIVSYNRLDKLRKTLQLFLEQELLPKYILVVNNDSSDGTKEFLEQWKMEENGSVQKYVINENENLGGSGGFHDGLQKAVELDADWVWVSDDDAYPQKETLKNANEYIEKTTRTNLLAFCAAVYDMNNQLALGHRKRVVHGLLKTQILVVPEEEYAHSEIPLNAFSYVGAIISKKALINYGLTKKDYFIWFDDTEHSLRISEHGEVVCVPDIKVNHENELQNLAYDWREYYGLRNEMDMYKNHLPRRCYIYKVILRLIKCVYLFTKKDKEYSKLYCRALKDAINNKLGKNAFYKPGWKPEHSYKK